MSDSHRSIILGAAAGLVAGSLTIGLILGLGTYTGAIIGILPPILAGAIAAWISAQHTSASAAAAIAGLEASGQSTASEPATTQGPLVFEQELARLHEQLERFRRLERGFARAERVARSFLASMNDSAGQGRAEQTADEVGTRLPAVMDRLGQTAIAIHRDASSLDELNERVASGAADQSDAVARTASAVEALSEKIDRISINAEEAAKACEHARDEAKQGLGQVHTVIEGMDRLLAQIEASSRKTRRLEDRSGEIGVIVETIRGISNRTDMLALNATIESVRAGEHGRGFAVVAEEIRKLSERTATATREISTIVEAIQLDTHESITALGQSQTEMQRESERIRVTGSALESISLVAERSARLVEGISRSTNDQVLATQDLVRAMQRISEVTHQTMERTNLSRTSLKGLVQACEPWQQLASNPSSSEPVTHRDQPAPMFANPLARRKREAAASESPR